LGFRSEEEDVADFERAWGFDGFVPFLAVEFADAAAELFLDGEGGFF
jgi:hypothetical protein